MSDPIYPKRVWDAGIQQASVPANINSLRDEALSVAALGVANDESAPDDGDVYIVGSAPTGAFASFEEHDIVLYRGGWHAWAPVANVRKVVNDVAKVFDGTEWINDPAAGSGGGGPAPVVELSGAAYSLDDLTAGAWHVFTSPSHVTITVEDDSTEPVATNAEFGLECRGAGGATLIASNAATIIPPKGGTLSLEQWDFAVLKRTDSDEYKVIGSTAEAL